MIHTNITTYSTKYYLQIIDAVICHAELTLIQLSGLQQKQSLDTVRCCTPAFLVKVAMSNKLKDRETVYYR
jgi:hypothetical protein